MLPGLPGSLVRQADENPYPTRPEESYIAQRPLYGLWKGKTRMNPDWLFIQRHIPLSWWFLNKHGFGWFVESGPSHPQMIEVREFEEEENP
jgi:hypothetical protein